MKNDEGYCSVAAGPIRRDCRTPARHRPESEFLRPENVVWRKKYALAPTGQALLFWNKIINGLSFANPQITGRINSTFQVRRDFLIHALLKVLPGPRGNYYFILMSNCADDIVLPVLFNYCGSHWP
jgi:hypothetical protein